MNELVRELFPTYFPTITSDPIQRMMNEVEQMFKTPIKQVFPYPIDVKRVYSVSSGKLIKLVFEVALAGLDEHSIKVQLKKGKFLTIKVERPDEVDDISKTEEVECIYSSKALTHKNGEITFKLFNDIDIDKFKEGGVTFKNGLLRVSLYVKEQLKDDNDVIDASIQ